MDTGDALDAHWTHSSSISYRGLDLLEFLDFLLTLVCPLSLPNSSITTFVGVISLLKERISFSYTVLDLALIFK